jgi:hypothetical protein
LLVSLWATAAPILQRGALVAQALLDTSQIEAILALQIADERELKLE